MATTLLALLDDISSILDDVATMSKVAAERRQTPQIVHGLVMHRGLSA